MLFEIYIVLNYAKKVLTAMVNNSTNINNTNDHFSAHITEHNKRTMTYGIGNPRPGLYCILKCLCSIIANMLATTIGSNKDYKTDICCFSTKHASLRNKNKDWWALNYDNMFAWKDML